MTALNERMEKTEDAAMTLLAIRGGDKLCCSHPGEAVLKFAKRSIAQTISDDEGDSYQSASVVTKKPRWNTAGVFGMALQAPPRWVKHAGLPSSTRNPELQRLAQQALPQPPPLAKAVVGGKIQPLCYKL